MEQFVRYQPKEGVEPYDIVAVQDSTERIFDEITVKPHMDSFLLENVALVQGYNEIPHKLDRVLRGWYLTRQQGEPIRLSCSLNSNFDAGADVKVELDRIAGTGTNHFDSTTNYQFTAPHKGYYRIDSRIDFAETLNSGDSAQLQVKRNSSGTAGILGPWMVAGTNGDLALSASRCALEMAKGDTLQLWVQHDHGANRLLSGGSKGETALEIESDETLLDDQDNSSDKKRFLRLWSARNRNVSLVVF